MSIIGLIFAVYVSQKTVVQAVKEPVAIVTETPTPAAEVSSSEVHSADGEVKVIMKKTGVLPASFEFTVSGNDLDTKVVYSQSLTDSYFSVPANSWSPDNKYFFIRKNTATESSYLVFKATGENFLDGSKYVDISDLFSRKVKNYDLKEVTGWDAPGLLHVLTNGPTFWFDLGSRAFLQLVR